MAEEVNSKYLIYKDGIHVVDLDNNKSTKKGVFKNNEVSCSVSSPNYSTVRIASFPLVLRELLHEVQFQVGDDKEDYCHAGQSQVVLPQAPGAPVDALTLQILLSSTRRLAYLLISTLTA